MSVHAKSIKSLASSKKAQIGGDKLEIQSDQKSNLISL